MNWYRTAQNTPSRTYKVFHESFAKVFEEMEHMPLSETNALEQWERFNNTLADIDPEFAEEMRNDFLSESIYGQGGWHRYFVHGNGDVYFSAMHAQDEAIDQAKRLGLQII